MSLSYSSTLWQGFSFISNNFNLRNREFTQINYLISEYAGLEYDFSKGLNRLVSLPFKYEKDSTLGNAIASFLNLLRQELEVHSSVRKTIVHNIQAQIEDLLGKSQGRAQINKEHYDRNEKSFYNILSELEELKASFHSAVQAAEKAKLTEYDLSIKSQSNEQKKKIHQLREDSMLKAKDAHDLYIQKIAKANESREGYIQVSKKIFDEYQAIDIELIEKMKTNLISLTQLIMASSQKIYKGYSESIVDFTKIDPILDINNFVIKNQTKGYKPFKLEFIPYSFSNDSLHAKSSSYTQKDWSIIENIRTDIKNMFLYKEDMFQDISSSEKQKIESLTHMAFEGNLSDQDKGLLIDSFKDKRNQQIFLSYLNLLRTQGLYLINEKAFETLVELFNAIVDLFTNSSVDYDILQYCLIISQTYFIETKDYDNNRVYLLNKIIMHPFWKLSELWTNLIKEAILTQINNKNDYMDYTKGITQEKEEAFNRVAFSNIMTYSDTLLMNGFQMEFIKKVIEPLCVLYSISQELIFENIEIRKDSNNGEAKEDFYSLDILKKEIDPKVFMSPQDNNDNDNDNNNEQKDTDNDQNDINDYNDNDNNNDNNGITEENVQPKINNNNEDNDDIQIGKEIEAKNINNNDKELLSKDYDNKDDKLE